MIVTWIQLLLLKSNRFWSLGGRGNLFGALTDLLEEESWGSWCPGVLGKWRKSLGAWDGGVGLQGRWRAGLHGRWRAGASGATDTGALESHWHRDARGGCRGAGSLVLWEGHLGLHARGERALGLAAGGGKGHRWPNPSPNLQHGGTREGAGAMGEAAHMRKIEIEPVCY